MRVAFAQAIESHNGVLSLNGRRLHPYVVPVFTGSTVTSYKLRMPSYSKESSLLVRSDVERYQILTKPPQIRFIPDEEKSQDKRQSTTLKSDPSKGKKSETYKISYKVFEDSSIEQLIRFLNDFGKVRYGKPVLPEQPQFRVFDNILDGIAKERWAYQVSAFTELPKETETGLPRVAPG